jgi:hypothetical protein
MELAFKQPFRQTGQSTLCDTVTVEGESDGGTTPPGDGGNGEIDPLPGPDPTPDPGLGDMLGSVGTGTVLLVGVLLLLLTQA